MTTFKFKFALNGQKTTEIIIATSFAEAKEQVLTHHDLSTMDEATLTDERGRVKVLRRPSLHSPLNRYRVEVNVILPKPNGDTYDELHSFTATSVEACRKLAASTAADFKAPARVAIYYGREEVERYNIGC